MKGETQADSLAFLVQDKKKYPEYELVLPSFLLKQSQLKKLTQGDVLLVGLSHLELHLCAEGDICADVVLVTDEKIKKLKITYLHKDTLKQVNTKKYEHIRCSFGKLQSRKLETGHKVSIAQLNLEEVTLFVNEKNIAQGRLVKVDDEIAIEIMKVNRQ